MAMKPLRPRRRVVFDPSRAASNRLTRPAAASNPCAFAALAGAMLLLAGCGVAVTVQNQSPKALADVTISGKGFLQDTGDLAPGSTRTVYVHPRGESGVKITFVADGRACSAENGYIEDDFMYRVIVTVAPDLSIDIDTNLR